MGLIQDALDRQNNLDTKTIDYARMNKVLPRQKAELTRVAKTKDPEKIAAVVKRHIDVWNEIGAWPDCWAHWQVTLNDALPWNQYILIENL